MKFKVLATAMAVSMALSGCVFHIDANNRDNNDNSAQASSQQTASVKATKQSNNNVFQINIRFPPIEAFRNIC
mgnify:CR=1 FL=1